MSVVIAGAIGFLTMFIFGWKLIPDTNIYSTPGIHFWPSPIGWIFSYGGYYGFALISLAGMIGIYYLANKRGRGYWLLICLPVTWYLLFPGIDSLGVLMCMFAWETKKPVWIMAAGLIHPVNGIVGASGMLSRKHTLVFMSIAAMVCIVVVGTLDTFSTTIRYAMPAFVYWVVYQ